MAYPPINSRPVKGAVFGYGSIGPVHMGCVRGNEEDRSDRIPEVEIVAVAEPIPERAGRVPEGVATYSDYQMLLAELDVDVAHICLAHNLHAPAVIAAAEKGVNVICEKPMALDADEARRMLDAVKASGIRFSLISQNRLNPEKVWLKEQIGQGAVGELSRIDWAVDWFRSVEYYADSGGWRGRDSEARGGVLSNQAYHTLDLSMWLADSPVVEVTAQATVDAEIHPGIDVPDRIEGGFVFANGVRTSFLATVCGNTKDIIEVDLRGRRNGDDTQVVVDGTSVVSQNVAPETPVFEQETAALGKACYGNSHQENIARSYEAFMSGEETPVTADDGIRVLSVIDAMLASNGKPVRIG